MTWISPQEEKNLAVFTLMTLESELPT